MENMGADTFFISIILRGKYMSKGKKGLRIALSVIGVVALVFIGAFCYYMLWEKAPEIPVATKRPVSAGDDSDSLDADNDRQDGVYTILLVGNDDGNGNTDTIMVGKIDTENHKMDFVSIPRDTLINSTWDVRKINAVYWGNKNGGGNGIDALKENIKKLVGFDIDCYAIIDLGVFIDTVDALGGVYFDVPQALDYEDPSQNLTIHVAPGYQLLNGYDAMGVCRYRSGYATGDIGRIEMQHRFLKACAEQFITLGNIPNISKVVDILSEGLTTDLDASNIAYFLRQALACKTEDINFYTAPNNPDMVHGYSYAILDLYQWIPMINEYLNPYSEQVTAANLDVVYREGGAITATTELKGADYYNYVATVQPTHIIDPVQTPEVSLEPVPPPEAQPTEPTPEEPTPTEPPAETEGPTIIEVPAGGGESADIIFGN